MNIEKARNNLPVNKKEEITFENFYKQIWLEPYKAGQTTTTIKPPTKATIFQTENIFRLHILPILGKYSIEYLNNNKQLILSLLTPKANSLNIFHQINSEKQSVELKLIERFSLERAKERRIFLSIKKS